MTGYIGIGGTAKKIKNIYIGVGGVAKQVKKAYIGVGGVAKQWYSSSLPTLAELFSDMVIEEAKASQSGYIFMNDVSYSSKPWYLFLMGGTASNIYRINYGFQNTYELLNKDGNTTLPIEVANSGNLVTFDDSDYKYCVAACVHFPHFSDTIISSLLSSMTYTKRAGKNSTDNSYLRTAYSNIYADSVYIAAFSNITSDPYYWQGISFSLGSTYTTPICALGNDEDWEDSSHAFLYKSGSYVYLSPSGSSTSTVIRGGSIHELSLA